MSTEAQIQAWINADIATPAHVILEEIRRYPTRGLINDEIRKLTGFEKQDISSCITKLREMGLVRDSGHSRRGDRGAQQALWVPGDDREKLRRHREKKLRKLADLLDYDLVPRR